MKMLDSARAKFRLPLLIFQWCGNLLLLFLGFLWLQIPDSHTWQFVFSMLAAVILAVFFSGLHIFTLARLRAVIPGPRWTRMLTFTVIFLVWMFVARWIASGSNHIWLYAADWNSKLSARHRVTFTADRLAMFLEWGLVFAQLILVAILIPLVLELGAVGVRRARFGNIVRPWRRLLFWVELIVAGVCGMLLTGALMAWTPWHSVGLQTFSVAVRLLIVWTVDVFLWMITLSTTAAAMDDLSAAASEVAAVA